MLLLDTKGVALLIWVVLGRWCIGGLLLLLVRLVLVIVDGCLEAWLASVELCVVCGWWKQRGLLISGCLHGITHSWCSRVSVLKPTWWRRHSLLTVQLIHKLRISVNWRLGLERYLLVRWSLCWGPASIVPLHVLIWLWSIASTRSLSWASSPSTIALIVLLSIVDIIIIIIVLVISIITRMLFLWTKALLDLLAVHRSMIVSWFVVLLLFLTRHFQWAPGSCLSVNAVYLLIHSIQVQIDVSQSV